MEKLVLGGSGFLGSWICDKLTDAAPDPEKPSLPEKLFKGSGEVTFNKARWEDLPTQYMVVNAFNALEIKEYRGASIEHSVGGVSLSNQRILH